ncbi:hypothetical protein EUX98_g5098 [Antrodiella citrinella]|uniref:Uncharacterized protein n=1 Tax=Antrodiella citrinella TaxID=2447956 RepID=A0A4S4N098_9APHY|nr:hypothetical protein EUX98_g5098 [Antrodiella citrinella]
MARTKQYFMLNGDHRQHLRPFRVEYRMERKNKNTAGMGEVVKNAVKSVIETFGLESKRYKGPLTKSIQTWMVKNTYLRKPLKLKLGKKPVAMAEYAKAHPDEHREIWADLNDGSTDAQQNIHNWWGATKALWDTVPKRTKAEWVAKAKAMADGEGTYDERRAYADKNLRKGMETVTETLWKTYGVAAVIFTARVTGKAMGDVVEIMYFESPKETTGLNIANTLDSNNFTTDLFQKWADRAFRPTLAELGIEQHESDDDDHPLGYEEDSKGKQGPKDPVVLKLDKSGWPLLPTDWTPLPKGNLAHRKDIIRVFISMHHAIALGKPYDVGKLKPPWKHYADEQVLNELIRPEYLPTQVRVLKDPSRMTSPEIDFLQAHWTARQNDPVILHTFRFAFVKTDSGLQPSEDPIIKGKKAKVKAKRSRKGKERAIVSDSDESDEDADAGVDEIQAQTKALEIVDKDRPMDDIVPGPIPSTSSIAHPFAGRSLAPNAWAKTLPERHRFLRELCADRGYRALLDFHLPTSVRVLFGGSEKTTNTLMHQTGS